MPVRPSDEGPSAEDLRRFGGEEAYCPDCGATIWDQADVCPKCYAYVAGQTTRHRPPEEPLARHFRGRWKAVVVIAVIAGLLAVVVGAVMRRVP